MIKGLNITVTIQRRIEGVDDEVGGATTTTSYIATGVRARISNIKPTSEQRIAGIETSKMYNCHIWPATIAVIEHDLITPEKGPHKDKVFLVKGVQKDSLFDEDPRAHISLRIQRVERARSIQ